MTQIIDLRDKVFGQLKVLYLCNYHNKYGRAMWHCKCSCGEEIDVSSNALINNNTKSCGCSKVKNAHNLNLIHNESNMPLYKVWSSMKERCYNPNKKSFKNYGGRGITVCEEWKNSYQNFRDWALKSGYGTKLTIERIDNNGNYEPNNCKWATRHEQSRNTRATHFLEYNGKRYVMIDLAKEIGIKYNTLANRILTYGWTVEKAVTTPVKKRNK